MCAGENAEPARRFRVLEHFYRLPPAVIQRFYADRLTGWDRLRIGEATFHVPEGSGRCAFLAGVPVESA